MQQCILVVGLVASLEGIVEVAVQVVEGGDIVPSTPGVEESFNVRGVPYSTWQEEYLTKWTKLGVDGLISSIDRSRSFISFGIRVPRPTCVRECGSRGFGSTDVGVDPPETQVSARCRMS